jgi:hypothetical protein
MRGLGKKKQSPTVDSFDRTQGEIPPPPYWTTTSNLDWAQTGLVGNEPPGVAFRASWSTPVFDLRPDLASRVGNTRQGFPIWRRFARLRAQLTGANGAFLDLVDWTIEAREFAQVFDANVQGGPSTTPRPNLPQINSTDVTTAFFSSLVPGFNGSPSVLGSFAPPGSDLGGGEGYPVRYYRVEFIFRKYEETGLPLPPSPSPPQPVALAAAVY